MSNSQWSDCWLPRSDTKMEISISTHTSSSQVNLTLPTTDYSTWTVTTRIFRESGPPKMSSTIVKRTATSCPSNEEETNGSIGHNQSNEHGENWSTRLPPKKSFLNRLNNTIPETTAYHTTGSSQWPLKISNKNEDNSSQDTIEMPSENLGF